MYAGQIVEQGPIEQVLAEPLHPYTQLLLARCRIRLPGARNGSSAGPRVCGSRPAEGCRFANAVPDGDRRLSELTPLLVEARPPRSRAVT